MENPEAMEKQQPHISNDPEKLDVAFMHRFLTTSYWAKGRTLEEVKACIKHSLNFGLYLDDRQIGYARVLTDYVYFAYVLDVFIDEHHRGLGYAKFLMSHIVNDPSLQQVKIWRLATDDAHGLYAQFGFKPLQHPHKMMERLNNR
jgi:GNAT superfamily N-acetyltransferase